MFVLYFCPLGLHCIVATSINLDRREYWIQRWYVVWLQLSHEKLFSLCIIYIIYIYIIYFCTSWITNVLSLSGRISQLEAVPIILVYSYLLSSCHFGSSYVSYNMGNWGKGMDCGSFLVGEAGWFCKVFKRLHLLHWLLLCSCSCICSMSTTVSICLLCRQYLDCT